MPPIPDADDAVSFYEANGWYITDRILPADLIARARDLVERIDYAERDGEIPARLKRLLAWQPGSPRSPWLNQYIALQYRVLADVSHHPALGEIAAKLSRSTEIRIFNTALIVKKPGLAQQYGRVGWHCDKAYWPTCSSERMLTAWVPLRDTSVEMGTLSVLSGSHRWPDRPDIAELRQAKTFTHPDHEELTARLRGHGARYEPVPIVLRAGQVSFHHCLTFHGSAPNVGSVPRSAISVHLQDDANLYRAARGSDGEPSSYVHDSFVRRRPTGEPDYRDPEICPLIWPGK